MYSQSNKFCSSVNIVHIYILYTIHLMYITYIYTHARSKTHTCRCTHAHTHTIHKYTHIYTHYNTHTCTYVCTYKVTETYTKFHVHMLHMHTYRYTMYLICIYTNGNNSQKDSSSLSHVKEWWNSDDNIFDWLLYIHTYNNSTGSMQNLNCFIQYVRT